MAQGKAKFAKTEWFVLAASFGAMILLMVKNRLFFHDDAYISLRYAVNFAETGLPQWNPGEWAEGYTSLFHISAVAALIKAGFAPVLAVRTLNLGFAVFLITLTWGAMRNLRSGGDLLVLRSFLLLALSVTPSLPIWTVGGLEAVVVAAFLMAGVACLVADFRHPRWWLTGIASLVFCLALLTRLDASVFIAGCGLMMLWTATGTPVQRFGKAFVVAGIPAIVSFVQMGFRYSAYGDLFPLTFYAKTGLSILQRLQNGIAYVADSVVVTPVFGAAALLLVYALIRRDRVGAVAAVLALQIAYIVWAGGDHMPAGRMMLPLLAPAVLLIYALVSRMAVKAANAAGACVAGVAVFIAVTGPAQPPDRAAMVGKAIGLHIQATWPENITIALNTAGSTPFYARENRVFIDMLGLNDPTIARRENVPVLAWRQNIPGHSKGDGNYVLSRKPDRIIAGPAGGDDISAEWFLSEAEMHQNAEFTRCYLKIAETAFLTADPDSRFPFTYYVRTCADRE